MNSIGQPKNNAQSATKSSPYRVFVGLVTLASAGSVAIVTLQQIMSGQVISVFIGLSNLLATFYVLYMAYLIANGVPNIYGSVMDTCKNGLKWAAGQFMLWNILSQAAGFESVAGSPFEETAIVLVIWMGFDLFILLLVWLGRGQFENKPGVGTINYQQSTRSPVASSSKLVKDDEGYFRLTSENNQASVASGSKLVRDDEGGQYDA